jgi:hypothetical protein
MNSHVDCLQHVDLVPHRLRWYAEFRKKFPSNCHRLIRASVQRAIVLNPSSIPLSFGKVCAFFSQTTPCLAKALLFARKSYVFIRALTVTRLNVFSYQSALFDISDASDNIFSGSTRTVCRSSSPEACHPPYQRYEKRQT